MYEIPDVDDFKYYFFRDFPYGGDDATLDFVLDRDIQSAIVTANANINQALWDSQDSFNLGFLYLAAHYLVTQTGNSSQGLAGQYNWIQQSKSVGSVSESLGIPEHIMENPLIAMTCKTRYGAQYISMLLPRLVGNMFAVDGYTYP